MEKIKIFLVVVLVIFILLRVWLNGGLFKERSEETGVVAYFSQIGQTIALKTESILPSNQAGLLLGMVLGVGEYIPKELKTGLQRTGTIHIVVVSGQNLTLLAGFLMALAPFLGRKKTVGLTLLVLGFYSLLTGFQVPVIRAAVMFLFVSTAQFFNREAEGGWVLILTALLMLLFNPNWLLSISFQLSFLATVGVVVVAPVISAYLKFLPEIIKQDFGVSLAATLMTLPIIAANFHQVSLISLVVNTLVLWTVPIIMVSGALAVVVYLINSFLGSLLGLVPGVFLTYFVYIVELFDQRWASVYIPKISLVVWLGYYLLILGVYLFLKKRKIDE